MNLLQRHRRVAGLDLLRRVHERVEAPCARPLALGDFARQQVQFQLLAAEEPTLANGPVRQRQAFLFHACGRQWRPLAQQALEGHRAFGIRPTLRPPPGVDHDLAIGLVKAGREREDALNDVVCGEQVDEAFLAEHAMHRQDGDQQPIRTEMRRDGQRRRVLDSSVPGAVPADVF